MTCNEQRDKNINLHSNEVKNKILKYLYTCGIKLNVSNDNILTEQDMNNIKYGDYVICPRLCGTRSWVLFFSIDNDYYSVNFPKHSQRKKDTLTIHPVDITVHKNFYNGTIMEGIYFNNNNVRTLVLDEVYMLFGQDQMLKSKDDRLDLLSKTIKELSRHNPQFNMYVSQYYNIGKRSLIELYDKIKTDDTIQDLIFYPKLYGGKIYTYTILEADLIDNIIKTTKFYLQKTKNPDVYNLLATETRNKIDIAYIPDMKKSKECKEWFKSNKCKELLVKCQMDLVNKKWIPLEIIEDDIDVGTNSDSDPDSDPESDSDSEYSESDE